MATATSIGQTEEVIGNFSRMLEVAQSYIREWSEFPMAVQVQLSSSFLMQD